MVRIIFMNYRAVLISALTILLLPYSTLCLAKNLLSLPSPTQEKTIFVHPKGNDKAENTFSTPFATIQRALDIAQPGDTILLMQGEYLQDVSTIRNGLPNKPIRITGMPGAIVKGGGKTSIFDIRHSYIELSNFSIDGLLSSSNEVTAFRKKLIYVKGLKNQGITGIKLLYMDIKNARDECIRIKYQALKNEVAYSHISYCGAQDYQFDDGTKNHNGEAIYIGTAPEQIAEGKNPTNEIDHSNQNWIHHNIIESHGSECIDVKEGSSFNIIEYNSCMYEKDLNVGGISIRGNNNTIRYNHVVSNLGAGIRLGGDTILDGINNEVYGNYLNDNRNGGLKIMRKPQGRVCGNTIITLKGQKSIRVGKNMDKTLYTETCETQK
jgi:hypothetical protein